MARWLIPAHAGKTSPDPRSGQRNTAHPRSRGENFRQTVRVAVGGGSSPLTRGKQVEWSAKNKRRRLIPAHAGKTSRQSGMALSQWAHPRSRGENSTPSTTRLSPRGSSPLTRGKPSMTWGGDTASGLIPAHAGKTHPRACRALDTRAHPRSRGENNLARARRDKPGGSSPLTRGKRGVAGCAGGGCRLIPAHAGKTGV